MAKDTTTTKKRVYFTDKKDLLHLPNLVDHQNTSWQWLVEEGLGELLAEVSPIDDYTGATLFTISDAILSNTYFGRGFDGGIWLFLNHFAYYAGQYLIASSVFFFGK